MTTNSCFLLIFSNNSPYELKEEVRPMEEENKSGRVSVYKLL